MIYLIDDKKYRQGKDFGWTSEKLGLLNEAMVAIYDLEELNARAPEVLQPNNAVLYHESFMANTYERERASKVQEELVDYANNQPGFSLGIFSGSKKDRFIQENIAFLPVSTLYQNLEHYVKNQVAGVYDLKVLLFGENPKIEEELSSIMGQALQEVHNGAHRPADFGATSSLFIRPKKGYIRDAVAGADVKIVFNDVSDQKLSEYVTESMSETTYDNIFVPLCFGPVLSDFNGLRLATHIRCTPGPNQLSNIFIYGFVGLEYLLDNAYFNILKTKGVKLVPFNISGIKMAVKQPIECLTDSDLSKEIKKLQLDPPQNYNDNHSVMNEWAIYQWFRAIGLNSDEDLKAVLENVETDVYFKYLRTVNADSLRPAIAGKVAQSNPAREVPNVLLVDDEADKGWFEIFAVLLGENQGAHLDYLGKELAQMDRQEIVSQTFAKIQENDIDVVILDFRLHLKDHSEREFSEITSIQIIDKIKEYNPGIQVIVLSATNKVWNLQGLHKVGADAFIYKDVGSGVAHSIDQFVEKYKEAVDRALWLKPVWLQTQSGLEHLKTRVRQKKVDKDYAAAIGTYLMLSYDSLSHDRSEYKYDAAFMYCFSILEASSRQFIDEDNPTVSSGKYRFQFRGASQYLKSFSRESGARTQYDLESKSRRIPYNQKLMNLIWFVGGDMSDPSNLVSLRNSFIHPNLIDNRRIATIRREDLMKLFRVSIGLISKI